MELTKSNYYSQEADRYYMSVSQYKSFLKCEAATMAKLTEDYVEPKSDALLFGSYVHAWLEGELDGFKKDNPNLFSSRGASKGKLKSQYQLANEMIEVLESDPFIMMAFDGDKEVIMTGELCGVPWKIRMDVYNPAFNRFADLKTVKGIFDRYWHNEFGYTSFVEAYGYVTQMAVYSEIERQNRGGEWLENYIVAVSKQSPPDKAVITVDPLSLSTELERVEMNMDRIKSVKYRGEKPKRCGRCEYCRSHKMITNVIDYKELIGG